MSGDSIGVTTSSFESSDLAALFVPEVLLPSQLTGRAGGCDLSPDKKLYLSILEDAIDCWLRGGSQAKPLTSRRAEEAERWIWHQGEHGGGIVTFKDCCEALGFLPEWLRNRLATMRSKRPMKFVHVKHHVVSDTPPLAGLPKVPGKAAVKPMAPAQLELEISVNAE